MISALILILALLLIAIGMPVAFAIGIAGTTYFLLPGTFLPDSTAVQRIVAASQSFPLLAVPLFILLGNLMNSSGITPRLVGLATVLALALAGALRGVIFTGFPWALPGHALIASPALHLAQFGGAIVLSPIVRVTHSDFGRVVLLPLNT